MEATTEVKKRGRGRPRKRRREEDENDGIDTGVVSAIKKQALELRWKPLVGRYVLKEFEGNGTFLGKVVYYETGLYRVDYEDGDCEDLESRELRQIVLGDDDFTNDLSFRRQKLDELLLKKSAVSKKELEKKAEVLKNEVHGLEAFSLGKLSGGLKIENDDAQGEGDAGSSSDSSEYAQYGDLGLEMEAAPIVPPPQLPPSSGNIGVPEEYVAHLFSVYAFLRSFNICLFLSPFTLDDLVGAVNCRVQNTLLDAIHVALIRALRHCLETQSSDGSDLASRCLRCIDWSLLDSLTWPVYLVHYLTIMGHVKGLEWEEFYDDLLKREYYSLPVSKKLLILQILCDDVLESAAIRVEIDIREELEDGIDPDAVATSFPQSAPKRVHPRYSKTSACKDKDGIEIISGSHEIKTSWNPKYLGSNLGTHDVGVDGNSDECRLCGMDGILLCCDGCPSAYHSRCIGVAKMYIPDGPWYCPECTINKLGPTVRVGTSLRGADLFGVDLYQQAFLGTCDHLLVVSIGRDSSVRYYNYKDIPNVLLALSASMQHRSLYEEISKAIAEYWKILPSALFSSDTIGGSNITSIKEDDKHCIASLPFSGNKGHRIQDAIETETRNALVGSNVGNVPVSCIDNFGNASMQDDSHGTVSNGDAAITKNCNVMNTMPPEQIKMESPSSLQLLTDLLDVTHQSLVDKSSAVELATCTCINIDGSHTVHVNGTCAPGIVFSKSKDANHAGNSLKNCLYVGSFFKPYAYINHYMHGEFAASAAACLTVLSTEESRGSDIAKSGSVRKVAADISLQVKAFSAVASRFFWPSYEKKLIDVPRERCGWCYSCKIPATSKKACMLNAAALTATKGTMKVLSGLRPIMHGEGSIRSISTYILYMGEVLSGLMVGPFLNASYIEQWRRRVEGASTSSALISPLLELEQSIRMIALSGDWVKVMDDWFVESSGAQNAGITVGYAQKRGLYGRRHRKQSATSDVMPDDCSDKSFIWWRGDKLLRLIFHKAVLPQSVVKRAVQEGNIFHLSILCCVGN
uniref:DDT domain-containing protein PTM n=1 Tax=Rhizophora mucronata TaxID=61149 RepID=A0A2P2JY60_RHIMU